MGNPFVDVNLIFDSQLIQCFFKLVDGIERNDRILVCTSSARMVYFGFQVKRQLEPVLIGLV